MRCPPRARGLARMRGGICQRLVCSARPCLCASRRCGACLPVFVLCANVPLEGFICSRRRAHDGFRSGLFPLHVCCDVPIPAPPW